MDLKRKAPFKVEFEGDDVTMDLKQLTTGQMLDLVPLVQKLSAIENKEGVESKVDDMAIMLEVLNDAREVIAKNVENVVGVTIDGVAVNGNDLVDVVPLAVLGIKVLMELIQRAKLTQADSGNSVGPSGGPMSEDLPSQDVPEESAVSG